MPQNVVTISSEISSTVSDICEFASDEEVPLAGNTVLMNNIYRRRACRSCASCKWMCPHPFRLASEDIIPFVGEVILMVSFK